MLSFLFAGRLESASPFVLNDITADTGIHFRHEDGSEGQQYLVEAMSGGLALFDYDGDQDIDIYFLNGGAVVERAGQERPGNALYRNDGGWKFTDVTASAGVGDRGFGLGVVAGDYDNDGDEDLYVSNYGPNVLYRNNGDGTFSDVTDAAGVADGDKVGAGVAFFDADRDGDLDLYVANYIQFAPEKQKPRTTAGFAMYPSPHDFEPEADTFFLNNGDGTFRDASREAGIAAHVAYGMGIVVADFDNDGDGDVFVCNDAVPNYLFENDGHGKFEEIALLAGVAYNLDGDENGSMGVDCGDFDNDSYLDFFTTDFADELPVLYRNTGDGFLEDATLITGAGGGAFPHVNWGTGLVDFDNDGYRDLFLACGHLQDHIEKIDDRRFYRAENIVLRNDGQGKFVQTDPGGTGLKVKQSSRGAAFDDLDNDGDLDVVVLNSRQQPTILRNDSPREAKWLQVHLVGSDDHRVVVGARVRVVAGEQTQIAEVHAGRGYQSHYGTRLHFGLGSQPSVERLEIRWSDGYQQVVSSPPLNQLLVVERE